MMAVPQVGGGGMLLAWGARGMRWAWPACWWCSWADDARFLGAPRERALWYSGFGVPLFVAGMMVSAFALRACRAGW
jgi:chlorophyll synthase